MFYVRMIYKGKELLRTNNFDTLKSLTNNINKLFYGFDIDDKILIKLFENHYERGYYQLSFDGKLIPLNNKNDIIKQNC